ncbi:GntR family transcriptional regulator [Streptomyces sp. NRRL B-24484]|uniref:GntR family transcriptional regulator n=1 Tax=Streptomyces sp. NRRL B-24484 TaxID=1463833 RepID=UPI001F28DEC0|nr:winged helix-turn-helix domain-containing protein [Streptomyces sp. NRRL B-24484]
MNAGSPACGSGCATPPRPTAYAVVAAGRNVIAERIESGEYLPGGRIPSVVRLQAKFGIASATALKVYEALRTDGLICVRPRGGSFVEAQA